MSHRSIASARSHAGYTGEILSAPWQIHRGALLGESDQGYSRVCGARHGGELVEA